MAKKKTETDKDINFSNELSNFKVDGKIDIYDFKRISQIKKNLDEREILKRNKLKSLKPKLINS